MKKPNWWRIEKNVSSKNHPAWGGFSYQSLKTLHMPIGQAPDKIAIGVYISSTVSAKLHVCTIMMKSFCTSAKKFFIAYGQVLCLLVCTQCLISIQKVEIQL